MTLYLKQSTASQEIPLGRFVDSGDGNSEEISLTINNTDIKLWKAGATTLADKNSGGATHIANGVYYCVLDATDTNTLGSLVVHCHVSGALAVKQDCLVLAANVYDSLIGGGDVLDVSTTQFNGSNVVQSGGRPEVNMTHIAGSSVSTSSAQLGVNVVNAAGTAWNSGAIGANTLASDTITAAKIATGAIDADAIADNAIDAGAIASNAITSAKIATDAITSAQLASSAITEIQSGLSTLDAAGVRAAVGLASANLDTQLADIEGKVDDLESRLGTPSDLGSGATVAANLVDIEAQTDNLPGIETKIDTIDTNVDSILADTGTDGVVVAAGSKTGYALSTAGLAAFFTSDSGEAFGDAVAGSVVKEIADNAGGSSLTVQDIVDGVLDEALAGHATAGTVGKAISDTKTDTTAILADTNELQTDWANGGRLDNILDARASQASVDTIDGIVDSILVDTAEIGAAGAGLTALASAASLATVDTVVDAIKVKTDQLTYGVASTLNANITHVNEVEVTGDGQSGTEWGPA